jgi:hypothetical protein
MNFYCAADGKLWVRYGNGLECPTDYEPAHGYSRCSVAEHIRRNVTEYAAMILAMEEERLRVESENRLRALGIASLAPGKEGGKEKKKKKK